MISQFHIGGILISSIVPVFFAALFLTVLVSMVLVRVGFYQLVWQRPIVDLAILIILFGIIVILLPDGWSLT